VAVQGEVAQQVPGPAGEVDDQTPGGRVGRGQRQGGEPARVGPPVQEVGAHPAEAEELDRVAQGRRPHRRAQLRVRRGRRVPPVVGVGEQHHGGAHGLPRVQRGHGPLAHGVPAGPQPRDAGDDGPPPLAVVQGDGGVGPQRRPVRPAQRRAGRGGRGHSVRR
jgi:hypothetical protein